MPFLKANEALVNYWDGLIPVNPIAIAQAMGVSIYRMDDFDAEGMFFYSDNKPHIVYKPSGNSRRDRFTIAHELGHFCLAHPTSMRDSRNNFNIYHYDPAERDANRFAAQLLMPESAVKFAALESSFKTVDEMCDYFDVSGAAMRIRLNDLGLI